MRNGTQRSMYRTIGWTVVLLVIVMLVFPALFRSCGLGMADLLVFRWLMG